MSNGQITVEQQGHLLLIGIDRIAKRNAVTVEMYAELAAAYGRLDNDKSLRCGVLFAHGDHFTGGIDLAQWAPVMADGHLPQFGENGRDPLGLDPLKRVSKPIIIAVQGYCYTIGLELLLAADIRVAASDTRLAMLEVKRGIFPTGGGTIRLPAEIGWGNAMRYLLTGDEFTAQQALDWGLVQSVTEPGKQIEKAIDLAERVAAQAPLAVQSVLKSARLSVETGEQASAIHLNPMQQDLLKTKDVQAGLQAFLSRKPAVFTGE